MDDVRIVELFLNRDEAAIASAGEKYGAKLHALARNILGDDGAAEECVNDAWLEAWNRIPPHEPREYLFAFLAKLVRAKALNRVRALCAEKRSAELVCLTQELSNTLRAPDDPAAAVETTELSASVSRYLRGVSEEKRRVFVRRYWYADSISQIADRYKISEPKVKSMLWRVRRELEKHLKQEGFLP